MRHIAVIDAETDPFRKGRIPKPFIWGFYDGTVYKTFPNSDALADYLRGIYCVCYAHNGGKFDFHYLLDELEPYDDIKIINGRIAQMYIGMCELRDSWLIINEPLNKYKKDDIDYAIMEPSQRDKPKNRAVIEAYLKNDCIYLYELVTEFQRLYGDNLTQAGASMKQWQKLSDMPMEPTDEEFYNELSPFYYGGRVQCFESGIIEEDFSVYDINSAYPFAMMHKHPYSANFERLSGYVKNADFYVISCIANGCFPYRAGNENETIGGLTFPDDNEIRLYQVTGWEHAAAIATNSIKNCKYVESIRFMKHTDFSVYINKFWKIRQEAKAKEDILGSLMAKLMMNSLYGKFAANPDNYLHYMIIPEQYAPQLAHGVPLPVNDSNPGELSSWIFGGNVGKWCLAQRDLDEHEKRYYNIATGASVTGFVRAMLWRAIHSSEGVMYCDTDSITARHRGSAVSLGDGLGKWKSEGSFDRAGIGGKKLYIFRGRPDNKGHREYKKASKGARLTDAQLWTIAKGGSVDYEPEVPTYSIHRMLDFDNPQASFTNRIIKATALRLQDEGYNNCSEDFKTSRKR